MDLYTYLSIVLVDMEKHLRILRVKNPQVALVNSMGSGVGRLLKGMK